MTEQSETQQDAAGVVDQASSGKWLVGSPDARPAVAEQTEAHMLLAGKRVLVADDESTFRRLISEMLAPCGCQVDTAADGVEACELVADNKYDLIISDIGMPGATGYDVFTAAKTASEETEVILMTAFGYDPSHSLVRANHEGVAAVLIKPFGVDDLLKRCRRALLGA